MADTAEQIKERENRDKNFDQIPKIIAAICPQYYARPDSIAKVNALKKAGKFWEAVDAAKPRDLKQGEQFKISYNSSSESLEPIYFWILDFLDGLGGPASKKLVDNFVSSPGSGHFSEMMGKATRMQEEGMKIMQTIGVLIKSVINIIYDLRQFESRLKDYKNANSKNRDTSTAGLMALKQTWLDNVDIKKGNSSIKAMTFSQQGAFVTLLNAFFMVNDESLKDINGKEIDLNDIVKRVLQQRISEFNEWKRLSDYELTKRFKMEKAWLKSQVDSLKLYARWAKPYLQSAEQLKMTGSMSSSAALVKAFNTNTMQLVVRKDFDFDVKSSVVNHKLPPGFEDIPEKNMRTYISCVFVDFKFRGIPQRVEQHYGFGGKSDVTFNAYGLSKEELAELEKRLGESDVQDALKLVEGVTTDSLKEIEDDIRYFLEGADDRIGEEKPEDKKKEQKEEVVDDSDPFTALLGKGTFWGKDEVKKDDKSAKKADVKPYIMKSENYAEKVVRQNAMAEARGKCFTVYDVYKKAHGMASVPFDAFSDAFGPKDINVGFKDIF